MVKFRKDNFSMWVVSLLPKWIIYYSVIRAGVFSSTGKYANTIIPELTILDIMKRWREQ